MASPTARDIMARSEATFSPEADIYDAVQQLLKNKLTGAAVVDGRLETTRDCTGHTMYKRRRGQGLTRRCGWRVGDVRSSGTVKSSPGSRRVLPPRWVGRPSR